VALKPLVRPAGDIVFLRAIPFLHFAEKRIVIPFDLHQIIVREFAPLPLEFAFELPPLAFERIGVHSLLLSLLQMERGGRLFMLSRTRTRPCWMFPWRPGEHARAIVRKISGLLFGRNFRGLSIDDAEPVPDGGDAENGFRETACFPPGKVTHGRSFE